AGGARVGEGLPPGGRHAGLLHELLREALRPLDLGRFPRRADDRDSRTAEDVAHALRDEVVGSDDREVDVRGEHVLLDAGHVVGVEADDPREERHAGVPRGDVDGRHARTVRKAPGDRVLPTAAPEHEAVEARRPGRAPGAALPPLLPDLLMHALAAEHVPHAGVTAPWTVTPIRSSPAASTRCRR